MIVAAIFRLVGLAVYRYDRIGDGVITADMAEEIEYADPRADVEQEAE